MPPLPRINTKALVELADELRFAPREAVVRDIERAEGLAGEVDPGLRYPADWVVFRVTGYRPELDDPALIPGESLLGDLSALVERLCDAAGLNLDDLVGSSETADELAARWSVSRKTLSRWRRRGLIARRVHEADGTTRLVVTAGASAAFATRHGDLLARAAGFSRLDSATEAEIVRRARRYREGLGMPITRVADRLATRLGRSQETVRQVLLRHDAAARKRGEEPVFDEPGALDERKHRVIERAWRRGIEPGELVRRYGRSRAGIHRIVSEQRLRRVRGLDLGRIAPEAMGLDGEEMAEVLGAAPVAAVGRPEVPGDMTELVALMRGRVVPVGVEERAWSRAEHALRARAARLAASIGGGFPEARLLDRAETDLRWAALLRAALAQTQLHLVLETLESTLSVELDQMRAQDARAVVEAGLGALRAGLDAFDPWRSGRLAAPVGLSAARVRPSLPARESESGRRRARVRILSGTAAPDWTLLVSPWVAGLRPDPRLAGVRGRIAGELAGVLTERFGLDAVRPRTLEEIAEARGLTVMQTGRLERRALRAGLEAARGPG